MRNTGQNIIEFAIIIAIVALGSIFALTILGGNINTMFSKSNDAVKEYKPFGNGPIASAGEETTTTIPESTSGPSESVNIKGTDVTYNSDGSASFTVGSQNIAMSSDIMNSLNTVFETSGSEGITSEVMSAIQALITEHEDEYPAGDMPLEISIGKGARTEIDDGEKESQYGGDAEANMTFLSVGDHMIVIQNDKFYRDEDDAKAKECTKDQCGVYILDGTVKDGKFHATIDGPSFNGDKITMDYKNNILNGNFNYEDGDKDDDEYWNWNFNFEESTSIK